jgi:hypothetical protein
VPLDKKASTIQARVYVNSPIFELNFLDQDRDKYVSIVIDQDMGQIEERNLAEGEEILGCYGVQKSLRF